MEQLADDVFQIQMMLRNGGNAYVLDDVLVDAGGPPFGKRILHELRYAKRKIRTHVVLQARGDHAGGSHDIVEETGVPVWTGAADVPALESGKVRVGGPLGPVIRLAGSFTGVPVARGLRDGDKVGPGFVVLETPGRSPGQISLWRERDRILICGDVWMNINLITTRRGLRTPKALFGLDAAGTRAAQERLAALAPELVLFGHGPVLRDDAAEALRAWTAGG